MLNTSINQQPTNNITVAIVCSHSALPIRGRIHLDLVCSSDHYQSRKGTRAVSSVRSGEISISKHTVKTDSSQFSVANDEDDIIAVHLSINSTLRIPKSYSFVKKQSCRLNMDSVRRESIALYRRIIRESRRLKPHERDYYRLFARGVRTDLFFASNFLLTYKKIDS